MGRLACIALLLGISVATAVAEPSTIRLRDVTEERGIDFVETIGDDVMSNIVESAGVGCAFLDYDGDGLLDIYFVNGHWKEGLSDPDLYEDERQADATDRLYRATAEGRFEDVTVAAGLAVVSYGMGVVAADYDADGDTDLYITNFGPNFLYRNNGDGTFTDVAAEAGVTDDGFSGGAVFFDYDRDGTLDLYVGNYIEYDPEYGYYYAPDGFPGPLAYAGLQDHLFRGQPDGTFMDVSEEAGIVIAPTGRAMGVGAFDFDGDGWLDVFVSNDAMENFLLRNRGDGTFENIALMAGVAFGSAGEATSAMAAEFADFDSDGKTDLFVPDIEFSCLYHNLGNGMFAEESALSGIAAVCGQYTSWGSTFADFDLDGLLDLYVSNGDVHHLEGDEDLLLRGDGKGGFANVSGESGDWAYQKFVSRGVARGDIDNDGDLDLVIASLDDRPVLLLNESERAGRHWIGFELVGQGRNLGAIGASVVVQAGERRLLRHCLNGGSYLSQHDTRLHFGLGEVDRVDSVEIVWPDGATQLLTGVAVDRYHRVEQEEAAPRVGRADARSSSGGGGID